MRHHEKNRAIRTNRKLEQRIKMLEENRLILVEAIYSLTYGLRRIAECKTSSDKYLVQIAYNTIRAQNDKIYLDQPITTIPKSNRGDQ